MMTPKEKAQELLNKYEMCTRPLFPLNEYDKEVFYNKQCALIAIEEILGDMGADRGYAFWTEVKQEIEQL